jgi:hypothetical protein
VKTKHLQLVTSEHSVTMGSRENVRSHFGPVNPASTTLLAQETLVANQLAQLSVLLSSLESVVENLNYKSFTLYDTLNTAIEEISAVLSDTLTDVDGTEEDLLQ